MMPPGICQLHWQGENELPALAGLHHQGLCASSCKVFQSSMPSPAKHRALIWQAHLHGIACISQNTAANLPGTPCMTALLWHHATCPRCAGFVHDPTLYNYKRFNINLMPPPAFFSCVGEFSLAVPHSWKNRRNGIKCFKPAQWR